MDVVAFNFNISQTTTEFAVEVVGAPSYDPDDADWVCDESWTCRPETFRLSYADVGKNWKDGLKVVTELVRNYLATAKTKQVLRSARAVTVGFVDGDLVEVHASES